MELCKLESYLKNCVCEEGNFIREEDAISPSLTGMQMYDEPIMSIGPAGDGYFLQCKDIHVVGPHHMSPAEWLPSAKTVISFFFPLTPDVCKSNAQDFSWPSAPWLHARIEGNKFIQQCTSKIRDMFLADGLDCIAPSLDPRFSVGPGSFSSNWSERHAACACGLGTFSLTKGIITKQGMAGRLTSIITNWETTPSEKLYSQFDQWCIYCGACINHCPGEAISREHGKDHEKCDSFLERTRIKEKPRYGCGKCQIQVPCEHRAPGLTRS